MGGSHGWWLSSAAVSAVCWGYLRGLFFRARVLLFLFLSFFTYRASDSWFLLGALG